MQLLVALALQVRLMRLDDVSVLYMCRRLNLPPMGTIQQIRLALCSNVTVSGFIDALNGVIDDAERFSTVKQTDLDQERCVVVVDALVAIELSPAKHGVTCIQALIICIILIWCSSSHVCCMYAAYVCCMYPA